MAESPDDRRLDLLQGTLIGRTIRAQSDEFPDGGDRLTRAQLVNAIGLVMKPAAAPGTEE